MKKMAAAVFFMVFSYRPWDASRKLGIIQEIYIRDINSFVLKRHGLHGFSLILYILNL
jgi:hypothetical protein